MDKNTCGVADREQRSNSPPLSSFASDLNSELDDWLAYFWRTAVKLSRDFFKHNVILDRSLLDVL